MSDIISKGANSRETDPAISGGEMVRDYDLPVTTEREAIVLPIVRAGPRVLSGAVYDRDGKLVPHSQRIGGGREERNPEVLTKPASTFRVEGRSLFGGILFRNFGHTLLEGTSRFWSLAAMDERPARIVYQASTPDVSEVLRDMRPDGYLSIMLKLAGYTTKDVVLVVDQPAVCDELVVPQTALAISKFVHPRYGQYFDQVIDQLQLDRSDKAGARRIYLSRSLLKGKKRRAENEPEIERLAVAAGFEIVHPQTLAFEKQIALVRGADVVAGCDGSAMHLTIFARPGTRIVCFDSRAGKTQRIIETLRHLEGVRIAAMSGAQKVVGAGGRQRKRIHTWTADLDIVRKALADCR